MVAFDWPTCHLTRLTHDDGPNTLDGYVVSHVGKWAYVPTLSIRPNNGQFVTSSQLELTAILGNETFT